MGSEMCIRDRAYAESGASSSVSVNQSTMPPTVKPTPPPSATAPLQTQALPLIETARVRIHLASMETTTETSLTVTGGGKSVVDISPQKFVSPSDESQPVTETGEVIRDDTDAVEASLGLSKVDNSKLLPEKRWHSSWKPHVDETSCSVETVSYTHLTLPTKA